MLTAIFVLLLVFKLSGAIAGLTWWMVYIPLFGNVVLYAIKKYLTEPTPPPTFLEAISKAAQEHEAKRK
jgi:hypothetical protein